MASALNVETVEAGGSHVYIHPMQRPRARRP